jgi:hypothetical protein
LLVELSTGSSGRGGGGSAPKTATPSSTAKPQFPARTATASASTVSSISSEPTPSSAPVSTTQLPPASEGGRYTTSEVRPVATASAFSTGGAAAAAAPAKEPAEPASTASGEVVHSGVIVTGLSPEQVQEIKSLIQSQQKFIGELLEHASRWELEGSELRIYFSPEDSAFAGLIEGRETLEKIRASSSKVLARTVRVCAKLESGAGNDANASRTATTQEMRAQFENDPMVRSMLQRFGGKISEVRRRTGE